MNEERPHPIGPFQLLFTMRSFIHEGLPNEWPKSKSIEWVPIGKVFWIHIGKVCLFSIYVHQTVPTIGYILLCVLSCPFRSNSNSQSTCIIILYIPLSSSLSNCKLTASCMDSLCLVLTSTSCSAWKSFKLSSKGSWRTEWSGIRPFYSNWRDYTLYEVLNGPMKAFRP